VPQASVRYRRSAEPAVQQKLLVDNAVRLFKF
jgi:hypothetical protein